MTMNITSPTNGAFTKVELDALQWLGTRQKWLDVTVTRRGLKEFDLTIEGTYDSDTGDDYSFDKPVVDGRGITTIQGHVTKRGYPKVQPQLFTAWFLLACLKEFWSMGLITCQHDDWSFIRDRDPGVNWAVFEAVLAKYRKRPYFSSEFLGACRYVWQAIAEDGHEYADNEDAIESILDADRLTMVPNTGEAANAELEALDKLFGYQVVMKELSRTLRLV
jgi:hypothetical protein